MEDLKTTYNKIAKDWFKDHNIDTWWIPGTDKFISLLPKNAKVLDVGCGAGQKSQYMTQKGISVTGVDFSESMLELAKKNAPKANFVLSDARNLNEISELFDGVLAQAVLLHFPKNETLYMLQTWKNKLKPQGYMYLAVKEVQPGQKDENILVEKDYGYEYSRFFSYYTLEELKTHLTGLNMKIVYENKELSHKTVWIQIIAQNHN